MGFPAGRADGGGWSWIYASSREQGRRRRGWPLRYRAPARSPRAPPRAAPRSGRPPRDRRRPNTPALPAARPRQARLSQPGLDPRPHPRTRRATRQRPSGPLHLRRRLQHPEVGARFTQLLIGERPPLPSSSPTPARSLECFAASSTNSHSAPVTIAPIPSGSADARPGTGECTGRSRLGGGDGLSALQSSDARRVAAPHDAYVIQRVITCSAVGSDRTGRRLARGLRVGTLLGWPSSPTSKPGSPRSKPAWTW